MRNYMIIPMLLLFNFTYSQQDDLINETFDDGIPADWTHYSTNWGDYPQWAVFSEALKEASGPYFGPVSNWIQLPTVDLTETTEPVLTFDLAMAVVDTTIRFSVWYTTDSVWNPLTTYGAFNSNASNIIDVESADDNNWTPLSTDYQTISIDLSPFSDESNIRFSLCSDYVNSWSYGVWYIDNVRLFDITETGIFNHPEQASFQLFPNPTNSVIHVIPSGKSKDALWKITDIKGKVIIEKSSNSNIENLDVSHFDSGLYLVQYISEGNAIIKQLIKD